ncbi:MAG: phosphoribosylanthranilate isomerase, partial [Acetatifactor sp.]|nr:phosphoribosylanthranilate isomerase [Acetatifactor sp.]
MKIKICGLSRLEDIACVNRLQPDYIGFVFWPRSKRFVSRQQAAQLKALLSPAIRAVGVFVDAPLEEVEGLLTDGIIDMAQLHGEETEEDIRYLQAVTGRPVIKAVKVHSRQDVEAWLDSEADYLLFDSGMGSGQTFDWSLLEGVNRPYFLAGGLGLDNLEQVITH